MGADKFSVEHFLNPYGPVTGQAISDKYGYKGLKEYLLFKVNGKRFEVTDVQENSVIMKRHLFFFGTLFSKEVSLDDYTSYADTYQKGFLFGFFRETDV